VICVDSALVKNKEAGSLCEKGTYRCCENVPLIPSFSTYFCRPPFCDSPATSLSFRSPQLAPHPSRQHKYLFHTASHPTSILPVHTPHPLLPTAEHPLSSTTLSITTTDVKQQRSGQLSTPLIVLQDQQRLKHPLNRFVTVHHQFSPSRKPFRPKVFVYCFLSS
jgi:hypothetical protein